MKNEYKSVLIHQHEHTKARVMKFSTPHGEVLTPAFMPVGTRAFVNLMTADDLSAAKSQIILGGNTYHMLCTPGMEVIQAAGGMHVMMNWHKPMLTDSGGFQVFSLSQNTDICKINEKGAKFKHPMTGKFIVLNSQTSIDAQKSIGADIIMAFDQCTPDSVSENEAEKIMQRTHRWLLESKEIHEKNPNSFYGLKQALFGIVQGGIHTNLHRESANFVADLDLPGNAIGGLSVGEEKPVMWEALASITGHLPVQKPRYFMGLGDPLDLIEATARGVDMYDCVSPSRLARHGSVWVAEGERETVEAFYCGDTATLLKGRLYFERWNIKNSRFKHDPKILSQGILPDGLNGFSRSALHQYIVENEMLGYRILTLHNILILDLITRHMREAIISANFESLKKVFTK